MGLLDKFRSPFGRGSSKDKSARTAKDTHAPKEKSRDAGSVHVSSEKKVISHPKTPALGERSYGVLVRPMVTEKATRLREQGQYLFAVHPHINKIEVKKAVRAAYGVDPVAVQMMNVIGKKVRFRYALGKRKDWKKAIVTLKQGQKIPFGEAT